MRNKIWYSLTVLVIAAMVIAGCGGGSAAPEPQAAPEATPTVAPAEAPAAVDTPTEVPAPAESAAVTTTETTAETAVVTTTETTTGTETGPTLTIWADNTRGPVLSALSADFETEYGVKVVVVEKGFGDIRDNFKTAGPTGEGPDIIIGAHDWLGELAGNGLLAEIDLGDKAASFNPLAVTAFTYEGKLYGMPYGVENIALFYNTDLVKEVPADWDGVRTLAKELVDSGQAKQGFSMPVGDPYHFYPILTGFGGYVFGRDDKGSYNPEDLGVDNEGGLKAAAFYDGLVKDGQITAGAEWDIIHKNFESGDTAMLVTGPWAINRIKDSGVPFAIASFPSGGRPFLGVQGFMISAFTKDPLLAQTFLSEFVATDKVMGEIFAADPRPSAWLPTAAATAADNPYLAALAEAGKSADPMPAIPAMSSVWGAFGDALKLIEGQSETPDTAFKNAAEQIRTAIKGAQ